MVDRQAHCLVHAAYSFNGFGVSQSCASIVSNFPAGITADVHLARARTRPHGSVVVRETLPPMLRRLPWRMVVDRADAAVDRSFLAALRNSDPRTTVAYVWPGASLSVIRAARELGIPVVREMINSACATSGPILDKAYRDVGLEPNHAVTAEAIAGETAELRECDFVFASNPEVEASLGRIGIAASRILATTFGWSPERYAGTASDARAHTGVRVLFVGSIGVRKGVCDLLAAWEDAGIDGELVLAGTVEPAIAELVDRHVRAGRVSLRGFVRDLGPLYRGADVFVFPTFEEGGPQVTYEAAGCGLPIITTPMGAARLVENGRTGIVVAPGDRGALTEALRTVGTDRALRTSYGAAAQVAARAFDYRRVGAARGQMLADIALRRSVDGGVGAS